MKRPVCLFALCYLLFQLIMLSFHGEETVPLLFEEGEQVCFVGKVENKRKTTEGLTLYLGKIQFEESVADSSRDTGQQSREKREYKGAICYMAEEVSNPDNQIPPMGSYIMVEGVYKPFYEATNPGQFDQKSYYKTQKIDFSIANAKIVKTTGKGHWLKERLWLLRCKWQMVYESICTEKEAGFLTSVVLGDKGQLDAELKSLFSQNGIAHILAVSGVCTLSLVSLRPP